MDIVGIGMEWKYQTLKPYLCYLSVHLLLLGVHGMVGCWVYVSQPSAASMYSSRDEESHFCRECGNDGILLSIMGFAYLLNSNMVDI